MRFLWILSDHHACVLVVSSACQPAATVHTVRNICICVLYFHRLNNILRRAAWPLYRMLHDAFERLLDGSSWPLGSAIVSFRVKKRGLAICFLGAPMHYVTPCLSQLLFGANELSCTLARATQRSYIALRWAACRGGHVAVMHRCCAQSIPNLNASAKPYFDRNWVRCGHCVSIDSVCVVDHTSTASRLTSDASVQLSIYGMPTAHE